MVQKHGIPLKQLHNYDISGPYSAFDGAIRFYEEIDRLVNGSVWHLVQAPWEASPELSATYAW